MVSAGIAEAASKRSVRLKLRASDKADAEVAEEVLLYENSHTLVIGIGAYINGWPRLSMAVKDAEERAKLAADAPNLPPKPKRGARPRKKPDVRSLLKSKRRLSQNASDWLRNSKLSRRNRNSNSRR